MLETINVRVNEARANRDQCRSRRSRLPLLREELSGAIYRLQSLEACVDEVQAQLDKLQSGSLSGMMASLLGRKETQLAERQAQLTELQQEFDTCEALVVELDEQVKEIEANLGDADAIEAEYEAALGQKQQALVEIGGAQAERLNELIEQISCAKNYEAGFEKAVQVGKHLTERLHSMTRSVGRSRTRGIASTAGGLLVAAAVNTVMRGGTAKPAVGRVIDGLEELHDAINALEWSSDEPRDERILQIAAGIAGFATDVKSRGAKGMVWDMSSVGPMLDAVQELIGHLKDIAAEITNHVKALEAEKQQIVEEA